MDAYDGNGICLPYDVLLDVLGRLPRRALARSRRVCRAWRAIVDAHRLQLPHFFPPRGFPGVFTNTIGCWEECYLITPPASGSRHVVPLHWDGYNRILHHCNGLLLVEHNLPASSTESSTHMCNPATARCAPLPRMPLTWYNVKGMFLAFDPAVTRHYDVFLFHEKGVRSSTEEVRESLNMEQHHLTPKLFEEVQDVSGLEEPKAKPISLLVFSSRTGQWESRDFMPGRCAPWHLYDVMSTSGGMRFWTGEYWRGSLYVRCQDNIIIMLRCSEGVYDLVQLPREAYTHIGHICDLPQSALLANYEGGVRYVALNKFHLQVWTLTEIDGNQIAWVLAHEANLNPYGHLSRSSWKTKQETTWEVISSSNKLDTLSCQSNSEASFHNQEDGKDVITDDVDYNSDNEDEVNSAECSECSWDSDEHNFIEVDESVADLGPPEQASCYIMGLHPHKNVLLFQMNSRVAYHLDTSRLQCLSQEVYRDSNLSACGVEDAFPYRPCYVDVLPKKMLSPLRPHS